MGIYVELLDREISTDEVMDAMDSGEMSRDEVLGTLVQNIRSCDYDIRGCDEQIEEINEFRETVVKDRRHAIRLYQEIASTDW